MSLLEIRDVSKRFGGLAALANVSYSLNQGEILGLIGPNGAGKTTLFNVINGFYPPTKGEVFFKGEKISHSKPHQICKLGIGRTFQVVRPLRRMTVLDNVIASAFLRAKDKAEAEGIAIEKLRFTGLYEDRDVLSKGLPLGKRKKLEITRALATRPEMLLLDESFAGLNPSEQNELIDIIRQIRAKGITIMVIEHHMKVIMALSDRIVVLNYGQKIAEGTPKEISGNPLVIEAYLGEAESA
ncbi:MAG TPA: ABC transporter ATP-binding protein [Thermodesulfobacteriota bacterium]|jgi:branched-chain amino acid transport system ATP-binding protein|nr:ABC transporter ATP-binding protein [Thermodesulfobacteriota bacterium]